MDHGLVITTGARYPVQLSVAADRHALSAPVRWDLLLIISRKEQSRLPAKHLHVGNYLSVNANCDHVEEIAALNLPGPLPNEGRVKGGSLRGAVKIISQTASFPAYVSELS
ncbi:hypothetical protein BaRGS_00011064 [Batillaria attramentaria]|uniref:Uncharacterized protein n=1 Tax=Batillaria attramentaria TaxID=370345 RepID=A0ABD0LDM5_9CAEN